GRMWARCWGSPASPSWLARGGILGQCRSTTWVTSIASRRSRPGLRPCPVSPWLVGRTGVLASRTACTPARWLPSGSTPASKETGRGWARLEPEREGGPPAGAWARARRGPAARAGDGPRQPDVRRPPRPRVDGDRVDPEEPRLGHRHLRPRRGLDPDRLPDRGLQGFCPLWKGF